ncbi:MAG: alpha-2-macroglobulin [Steroidobacteraceae bacterium]
MSESNRAGARVASVLSAVVRFIGRGLAALFGQVHWQPPAWAAAIGKRAQAGAASAGATARRHPRATAFGAIAFALSIVGGLWLWQWYQSRPKPVEVTFAITAPPVTCYACEPPGTPNPLVVRFSASVAPLDAIDKPIEGKRSEIDVKPLVRGTWSWDDDKTLRFQPENDWPVGERYSVELGKRLVASHVRLQAYDFEFRAPAFQARIANTEFHQDPVVARNKKVVATIAFTHPVDPAEFERRITLEMFDRVTDASERELSPPAHTVVYDKLKLNAYIHTGELEIPPKRGRLQLIIAPGVRAARGGNETPEALQAQVDVPGLNSLAIEQLALDLVRDERNEPNQVLIVSASSSVLESEMPAKVKAWLLPLKHPDSKLQAQQDRYRRGQPFQWSESTLRPEVLTRATQLELKPIPGERDHYELHSFRYEAEPGRQLYVRVERGLKSFGGYVLGDNVERILTVPEFPRELAILHQGALLAMSGEKTLTVFARNVPAIRFDVGRLLPRQLQHLISQSSGSFALPVFQNWAFDDANITEHFTRVVPLPNASARAAHYEALNLGEYLHKDQDDRRGIFLLRVQAWDPQNDRPLAGYAAQEWNGAKQALTSDARLIVITDLGLLAKRSVDGSRDVFVQSIATGEPVAGATVEVIGRNGLPVVSETTDEQGHARFPDLKGYSRERQPVFYLVRRGGDSSFLPLDERGQQLDLSRFDIGGVESNADQRSLSAYLFSDRGLYRPGEQIRIGAIVRSQNWSGSLDGVPLRLEIADPRGVVIRRETFTPGPAGFGEILQDTQVSAATGTYTVSLALVRQQRSADLIGSTTVQVRDFMPDRLRMQTTLSTQSVDGWVQPTDLTAQVKLENLFGTPAENRRITAQMTLSPQFPAFRQYPDYRFFDPQYAREGFSEALGEVTTDAKGEAKLILNLQRFARATYRVHVLTQGFEADGGRAVSAEVTQLVSNLPYLIGYKADGDLDYLSRDSKRAVQLIAIDPQAQRTAVKGLKLQRVEIKYVSVLMRQPSGVYKYESRRKESVIAEESIDLAATGNVVNVATDGPGQFAYVIRDAAGQALTRVDYQVAGAANVTRALEKNAELELALSKKDYAPGEEIEVSIRAPYAGAGLITIERERVHAWRWFKTSTTSSVQRIRLPQGLEGNAYVSVSFVRDPGSSEIYMSPLSHGVQAFSIATDARREKVQVEVASLVKPGAPLKLRYRTDQPARIVLFAVDEGILQVAKYRAPDPLGYFFQKRALEVSTTQILDLILPEFRHLNLNAAAGGDAESLLGKHLNPFRRKGEPPVVFWSGILDSDATPREVSYPVPDYFNGTLRVFAVAVADERIGVADARTLVRGDFVLSPNAPTTVTPGDEFDVSVGVSNNVEGSGAKAVVQVELQTDAGLQLLAAPKQDVVIAEGREAAVRFRVRAQDRLGAGVLTFSASTAGGKAQRRIDVSVRPATPYMTRLQAGVLDKRSRDVQLTRSLYPHYRTLEAGVSVLPLSFAHGFASYLANYPYACTEQIVSQAVPALVLAARPEFGYVRKQAGASLPALLAELRSRQNDAGAYKLWPGGDEVVGFVSIYAQHLLIEAQERGEAVPQDLLDRGNQNLRALAGRDGNNLTDERNSAYAIYLLTRQGQRMAAELAAIQKRLDERYRDSWRRDLTAAWLAAALDLMQQREGERLIKGVRTGAGTELYNDGMTQDAWLLYLTARHFPERLPSLPATHLSTLAERVNRGEYHSLAAGTTLLALDAYATAAGDKNAQLSIAEVLRDRTARDLTLPDGLFPKTSFTADAVALRFGNASDLPAYYLVEQSGFDRKPPSEAIKEGLEVIREYTDAQGKALTQIKMGQEVNVRLKFRSLKSQPVDSVALVDLLPGGFDLVVPQAPAESRFAEAVPDGEGGSGASAYTGWTCAVCASGSHAQLQYADMREDRVVFYATATTEVQQVVYRIKATNVGTFTVPPAYGEAMYESTVKARSVVGKLEVVRP